MGLFSDEGAMTRFNWHEELGIFIHSRYDFDTVLHHLRHFPVMKDENGKWFFFRFYDPKVLRNYLDVIATSPENLISFLVMKSALFMLLALALETVFIIIKLKHYQKTLETFPLS